MVLSCAIALEHCTVGWVYPCTVVAVSRMKAHMSALTQLPVNKVGS